MKTAKLLGAHLLLVGQLPHQTAVVDGDPSKNDELLEEAPHLEEVVLVPDKLTRGHN